MYKKKSNNKGYSLVEFIIVLGIIAVLSGLAAVTTSSISTARATAAKTTFNQALSTVQTKTKSSQDNELAICIIKEGNNYYVAYGTYTNGGTFLEDTDKGERETLGKVTVWYTDTSGNTVKLDDTTSAAVKFNKTDGSIAYDSSLNAYVGAGVYTFCKYGSTSVTDKSVGRVTVNATTGSHYTGSVKS